MSPALLIVAALYAALLVGLVWFESWRTRRSGPDVTTIFVVICGLQCCVPALILFSLLPFADPREQLTGNDVFDRILRASSLTGDFLVLELTVWFLIWFYVGGALARRAARAVVPAVAARAPLALTVKETRLLAVIGAGLGLTLFSFHLMGDSLLSRYTNLVLLRAGFEGVERNTLNANALALNQTWCWLSVFAIFVVRERHRGRLVWLGCIVVTAIFAILGVSRRALFLPLLLGYLCVVLSGGRWNWRWLLASAVPLILWVGFGKAILSALVINGNIDTVVASQTGWLTPVLRASSDAGITVIESLGTLQWLHLAPRLGVDHLLSIAQRFPKGTLGYVFSGAPWDFNFPERIVRVSTVAFDGPNAQDLPPGLLGQMWLDFRIFGPVVWGIVFGLQVGVMQFLFDHCRKGLSASAFFVLVIFVIALPLNSGSFDFTFSIDIMALAAVLAWCVRLRGASISLPSFHGASAPLRDNQVMPA